MFTRIATIWYQLKTDEIFRKKAIFFVGVAVVIVLLLTFIIWINTRDRNTTVNRNSQTSTQVNQARRVTVNDFNSSGGLSEIFARPVGQTDALQKISNRWYYLDDKQQLTLNGEVFLNSPRFVAQSIYRTSEGVVVNEPDRSTWFNNGVFTPYPIGTFNVVPASVFDGQGNASIPGYFFLSYQNNTVLLSQATDIRLTQELKVIGSLTRSEEVKSIELYLINNRPYIFTFDTTTRQGNIGLWTNTTASSNNSMVNIRTLSGVQSLSIGEDSLMITTLRSIPTELTLYSQSIIDLSSKIEGVAVPFDVSTNLGRNKIFGSLIAQRCDVQNKDQIICLVKEQKVNQSSSENNDKIVSINPKENSIEVLFDSSFFSGYSIIAQNKKEIAIVSQINRKLYQLTT